MNNHNKCQTIFSVVFKNLPYTDEEWKQLNEWRKDFSKRYPHYASLHPDMCEPFENRPCHANQRGPTCYSHEEARKVCEQALEKNAQMVGYSVWPNNSHKSEETWTLRRNGRGWTKKKI